MKKIILVLCLFVMIGCSAKPSENPVTTGGNTQHHAETNHHADHH